jgi:hypothetical protein
MSEWTEQRLQRLYARYNCRFWAGRLPAVRVCISNLAVCYGEWDVGQWQIKIDIERHESNDREIRATLLHEMAHVAAGPGHNSKFWLQIERLLRQRAPITVGFPEAGGLQIVKNAVPKRLPQARRLLNKAHQQQQRRLEAQARRSGVQDITLTDEDLVREFADTDMAALPWSRALWIVGSRYGLLDVDGRPKDRRSTTIISRGKKVHYKTRRDVLETLRIKAFNQASREIRFH